MTPPVIGTILIIFGIINIIKPEIFKPLMRRKIVFNPENYSSKRYNKYFRALGGLLIIIGIFLTQIKYK